MNDLSPAAYSFVSAKAHYLLDYPIRFGWGLDRKEIKKEEEARLASEQVWKIWETLSQEDKQAIKDRDLDKTYFNFEQVFCSCREQCAPCKDMEEKNNKETRQLHIETYGAYY